MIDFKEIKVKKNSIFLLADKIEESRYGDQHGTNQQV